MSSARSLPLAVLVAVLALVAAPLAAASAGDRPAATADETTAAAPAPLSSEPPAALPWELPVPQQTCYVFCREEGACWVCYDCVGHCQGINCPWGDFQCH